MRAQKVGAIRIRDWAQFPWHISWAHSWVVVTYKLENEVAATPAQARSTEEFLYLNHLSLPFFLRPFMLQLRRTGTTATWIDAISGFLVTRRYLTFISALEREKRPSQRLISIIQRVENWVLIPCCSEVWRYFRNVVSSLSLPFLIAFRCHSDHLIYAITRSTMVRSFSKHSSPIVVVVVIHF